MVSASTQGALPFHSRESQTPWSVFVTLGYWTRRWTVQELYKTQHERIKVTWGKNDMLLQDLKIALYRVQRLIQASHKLKKQIQKVHLRLADIKGRPQGLLELLVVCSQMSCSDPRDALWSLRGLGDSYDIVPDFEVLAAEVYTDFAQGPVEVADLDTVLSVFDIPCVGHPNRGCNHHQIDDLPSWFSKPLVCAADIFPSQAQEQCLLTVLPASATLSCM
ncbi:hypothetical protein DOTSEDRAFT_28506 [Dothistroma septosporum NZE10]|uniref:Uncharacterized protein n=1 Tax=Dothistroma septosporum (strain NZE10 / CBS 128990) TaxID=675120 RepID=M2XIR8_DOTSN|nr:hypothetical protein DOTSEDRAFT_28506 [Dothistroma septosporum NZE10]